VWSERTKRNFRKKQGLVEKRSPKTDGGQREVGARKITLKEGYGKEKTVKGSTQFLCGKGADRDQLRVREEKRGSRGEKGQGVRRQINR